MSTFGDDLGDALRRAEEAEAAARASADDAKRAERALQARLEQQREDAQRREDIAQLKRLLSAENARQDTLAVISHMVSLIDPPKFEEPPILPAEAPRHTWVVVLSDWQLGQRTTFEDTGGVFEQTTEVTRNQIYELWRTIELLFRIHSQFKVIDEIVFLSLGDLLEGDQMRVAQAGEIDSLVTTQALGVLDLEAWIYRRAMRLFRKVTSKRVGGNHDRTSTKPGNAGLGELGYTDNYSWLVGEFLKRLFAESIEAGKIDITNHESFFGTSVIAGHRFVYEHGASFRSSTGSYGGVSYYSIANAAAGYQRMLDGADFVVMGHHHIPMVLPMGRGWQILNGALPPSSRFAQSNFKGVRRPCQVLLELHEKEGLTGWHPIYLETPGMVKPGQFWQTVHGEQR